MLFKVKGKMKEKYIVEEQEEQRAVNLVKESN